MLSSEYPLVEGRQAVAMAQEKEHKERAWVKHSEKSHRHIREAEWDWGRTHWSLGHQEGDLYLHICLGEQLTRNPTPCLGSKCKDLCSLLATFTRGHSSQRHGV